ncbi:cytochrome P450 [Vallicoccus soli]|uniref:Cytochrome P450 n=1 Tax=Vallicoccus soli TaxID=2339232 RepID=A0A3A3ZK13_9ACTN|nr:cytochrome P450 [Vallicoccus soli]RJK96019.1 cytochrome P450 [Vallicoccus soli]
MSAPPPAPTPTPARTAGPPAGPSREPYAPGELPPGPRAPAAVQTVAFHRDPLGTLQRARDRYGDLVTVRLLLAGTLVECCDPQDARRVLDADPGTGQAGRARQGLLGMVSERSVLGGDGAAHREARARVAAAFVPAALEGLAPRVAALAAEHAASWPTGRPTRLLPRVRALCDDVFVRLVLGVEDPGRARALAGAVQRMLWTPGNPPTPVPGQQAGPLVQAAARAAFAQRSAAARRLLADEVRARRAAGRAGGGAVGALLADDALGVGDAVDQLLPLTMAGQEPPAAGLAWVLERSSRLPALDAGLRGSAPGGAWWRAAVSEVLRVRPPVHTAARVLVRDLPLASRTLPAGVVAAAPIVLLHRDPRAWEAPEEVRPERFLRDGRHVVDEVPAAAYLPFGGGARRCLGEPLTWLLADAALPAVLARIRVAPALARAERQVVRGTVLVPHRGALSVLHPA